MPEPYNAACFSQPHWKVVAQGFDVETWLEDDQLVGTGGIRRPEPEHLLLGNRYYRFADGSKSKESQVGGGWWVEYEHFNTIRRFAEEHKYTLSEAARLFLALPYDWTQVNRLVSAILEVPLKAYAGEGKPAEGGNHPSDRGTKWIPLQHRKVKQLYIPGLVVKGVPPEQQLYLKAFPHPIFDYIAANRKRL